MFEVIPGILEKEWGEIEKKLIQARTFAKTVHIDFIDGKFVSSSTFMDPAPFEKYSKDLTLELHMMVENPLQYLKPFADAGFKRFIGHIEQMELVEEFIAEGELLGEVGIALDGPTGVETIENVNLEDLDSILVYTADKVGASGPPFDPSRLDKIRNIRERITFEQVSLEVDGGVNENTIIQARDAGANRFVVTSAIWNSEDPKAAYEKLTSLVAS